MPDFVCPVCRSVLHRGEKSFTCENGHNFDISRYGYVNLLMSSSSGKRHGDDRLMVRARRAFLDKGYYDRLSELISGLVLELAPNGADIIDAGCGECKYTYGILKKLTENGKQADIAGIDISKDALIYGSKRSDKIKLAVASSRKLPFGDGSADIVLSIFAPFEADEFSRVLKDGGCVIRAYPLERHLWELKSLIYDEPYENTVSDMEESGFEIKNRWELKYEIEPDSAEDVENLFKMTPYYYKTGENDQKKLENITCLKTAVEFGVIVYVKKEAEK